jgi:hypothetical protein
VSDALHELPSIARQQTDRGARSTVNRGVTEISCDILQRADQARTDTLAAKPGEDQTRRCPRAEVPVRADGLRLQGSDATELAVIERNEADRQFLATRIGEQILLGVSRTGWPVVVGPLGFEPMPSPPAELRGSLPNGRCARLEG